MNRMMITSSNTMGQLQKKLESVANNISNTSTTGFKKKETYFSDMLAQEFNNQERVEKEKGRLTPNGIRVGVGAKMSQSQLNLAQGSLQKTERDLDVALTNENLFFSIRAIDGNSREQRFTKDGAFYLSPVAAGSDQLRLVTSDGHLIVDENNQEIRINGKPSDIKFTENGQLNVSTENGMQSFNLGIVSVEKPQFMEMRSNNTFALPKNMAQLNVTENDIYTQLTGATREQIALMQGNLEQSNVDMSTEMTEMMQTQRLYQFQSRTVSMADQMMGLVNGIR